MACTEQLQSYVTDQEIPWFYGSPIYMCISSTQFMPLLFLSNLVAHLHLLILMKVLTVRVLHFSDEFLI